MVRVAPDANDVLVLMLDESTSTKTNAGTAGASGNWTDYGSPISNCQGLLGGAMYIPSAYLVNSRNGCGGANDVLVTPSLSLSGWVFTRRWMNYPGELFNKQYFLNGWTNPFLTFGFQSNSNTDGQCDLYITLGGVLQSVVRAPTAFPLAQGKWNHIGGTWDGSTVRFYINGTLVQTGSFSGTIDYGTLGNRGQWYVGGIPGTTTNQDGCIIVQDIRVANVVRPQSYFANIYYNGMFVNG